MNVQKTYLRIINHKRNWECMLMYFVPIRFSQHHEWLSIYVLREIHKKPLLIS